MTGSEKDIVKAMVRWLHDHDLGLVALVSIRPAVLRCRLGYCLPLK